MRAPPPGRGGLLVLVLVRARVLETSRRGCAALDPLPEPGRHLGLHQCPAALRARSRSSPPPGPALRSPPRGARTATSAVPRPPQFPEVPSCLRPTPRLATRLAARRRPAGASGQSPATSGSFLRGGALRAPLPLGSKAGEASGGRRRDRASRGGAAGSCSGRRRTVPARPAGAVAGSPRCRGGRGAFSERRSAPSRASRTTLGGRSRTSEQGAEPRWAGPGPLRSGAGISRRPARRFGAPRRRSRVLALRGGQPGARRLPRPLAAGPLGRTVPLSTRPVPSRGRQSPSPPPGARRWWAPQGVWLRVACARPAGVLLEVLPVPRAELGLCRGQVGARGLVLGHHSRKRLCSGFCHPSLS